MGADADSTIASNASVTTATVFNGAFAVRASAAFAAGAEVSSCAAGVAASLWLASVS